ncbi:MAG: glycoside hydrolase family 5 protein [Chthoniobacterales bacterium]
MRVAILVSLGVVLGALPALTAIENNMAAANARLGRGVNLGNALEAPKEGAWGVTLQSEYFRLIKEAGFDTVRLPVRWSAHAQTAAPYTIDPAFAERVDWAIDQATTHGLNIVVNVHHYNELDKDPAGHLERMTALWSQIAERYHNRPDSVYFELYNEPHDAFDAAAWNDAIPHLLAAVRKYNPTRPVIVGPVSWNNIRALEQLKLPESDCNLIVTVHYYEPFEFTHQGAEWAEGSAAWMGRSWTGSKAEKQAVRESFESAARWGQESGRPIFLGEFGAYSKADLESRRRWTEFVASEAQRLGFSRAYWEFCAGFGLYDPLAKAWREPLKAAVLGESVR